MKKIFKKESCNLENTDTILFVGSLASSKSYNILIFIIKDLLPFLKNTKLLLVGSIKDYYLTEVGKLPDNVLAFGTVDELEKYEIYKSDIAINPMFSGSGTNIKMLDYFSAGIPVVTTKTGARGLTIENNKEAIICSPDSMLQSIQQLMRDQKLQDNLEEKCTNISGVDIFLGWDS